MGKVLGQASLLIALLLITMVSSAQQSTRVAFGCCANHAERQPVFDALTLADPDVFVFLGNTLDVSADDMDELLEAYEVFNRFRGPRVLRRQSAVMSVWNLNDYAIDGQRGVNNQSRYAVRNHFLTFWREPITSPRMFQSHGIAKSVTFGKAPRRVQVIVLDGRWNRDPLPKRPLFERLSNAFNAKRGPYLPHPSGNLLGDEQWQWLAKELQKPAEVRVLMSATPFYAPANGYDSWAMYAQEQARLEALLEEIKPNGLLLAVGDRHFGEFARIEDVLSYPLWQVTSGSLSHDDAEPYYSEWRVDEANTASRYGHIEVLWGEQPQLILSLRNEDGRVLQSQAFALSELQPR